MTKPVITSKYVILIIFLVSSILKNGAQEPLYLSCLHFPVKVYDTKDLVKRYTNKNVTMFET